MSSAHWCWCWCWCCCCIRTTYLSVRAHTQHNMWHAKHGISSTHSISHSHVPIVLIVVELHTMRSQVGGRSGLSDWLNNKGRPVAKSIYAQLAVFVVWVVIWLLAVCLTSSKVDTSRDCTLRLGKVCMYESKPWK